MHSIALIPWLDPAAIIDWAGPWALVVVCFIVFAETGLLVGFLLPGDTLLIIAGLLSHPQDYAPNGVFGLSVWWVALLIGLSAFIGLEFVSVVIEPIPPVRIAGLSDIPVLGQLLFAHNPLVYLSIALFAAIQWFLFRTRAGLVLRAVGESPHSAHAIGYPVVRIRYLAVLFGGACAGVGGAYLSIVYNPSWVEGMTAGRGWIALALVVFATWRPGRVLFGAYLFGGVTIAQFFAQGAGVAVPSQFLSALPYLATIVVLVLISRNPATIRLNAPVSLGRPYRPD